MIRFSDIANAAAFFGVPEKTLERWYYDYVERQRQAPPTARQPIQQLGIDELKLTHGSGQFVAVIVDHTNERVLEVLKNRSKEAVRDYLQQNRASGLLAQVIEVTTDMWDGYVEAVREVFGERVRITIDRFHVMKNFQDHLTAARREIQRPLPKEEAKALKGTRWLWLTNQENLTEEERGGVGGVEGAVPVAEGLAGAAGKVACTLRGPDDPHGSGGGPSTAGVDGAGPAIGPEGVGGLLQDVGELVGQDRQLLCESCQQRSRGRVQPRPALHLVACLRDVQL